MYATINGIQLFYHDHGPPDASTVLLLAHAFPTSSKLWQHQVTALSGSTRLILPDLRGFGQSDAPAGPYTMEQHADDMAALMDHLELEQVVFGGVSMGGYISFAMMRQYPQRVRGLVLACTRAVADTPEGRAAREADAQLAEQQGAKIIADQWTSRLLGPNATLEQHTIIHAIIAANPSQGIAEALRGMGLRPDSNELLSSITVPTLVIAGSEDTLMPTTELRTIHEGIAGSQYAELAGAGHLANFENPTAFNTVVREFLSRVGG